MDAVTTAWGANTAHLEACRSLDDKLRVLARALKNWRASYVGSIRLQLATAHVVIYELDLAQESRQLSPGEIELRKKLKANTHGLACASAQGGRRLHEYFHLQACHRHRKNYLFAIDRNGQTFSVEQAKANVVYSYYDIIL